MAIPQVLDFATMRKAGAMPLTKPVREYLSVNVGGEVSLRWNKECRLSADLTGGIKLPVSRSGKVRLPDRALGKLDLTEGIAVAFVERKGAVAIKKAVAQQKDGPTASVVDHETPLLLTRVLTTSPSPEELLATLSPQVRHYKLPHDVGQFWVDRRTVAGWLARGLLGTRDAEDAACVKNL